MGDPFGRQTWTTIADRDNETMEWVGSRADTNYRARLLEPETEKRVPDDDPRRTAAPLSIMRPCTRNYAPRFSGIAKNSRRCRDRAPAAMRPVVVHPPSPPPASPTSRDFLSFRHLPFPSLAPRRIINVTEPGLPSHPPPPRH